MATLRDLSKQLGLSVTQISRALNDHSDVSAETKARVFSAAKALNYYPNISARRLVTGKSGIVGLVLPGVPSSPQDSLFVQIVGGLSQHFSTLQLQFVLHISAAGEDVIGVYRKLINSGALDGFVLLEPMMDDPRIAFLRAQNVPFVLHGRHEAAPDYPFFDIDNVTVGYDLTRYLIARGHRRIAYLNGLKGRTYSDARSLGYLRALREAGIVPDPGLHLGDEMTAGFGLLSTVRLWDRGVPAPTAIICGNTLITKGVFESLKALGLRVPQDVSVVAHDDELPGIRSSAFEAPLTVTYSPLQNSWEYLARMLAGAIDGAPIADLQQVGRVSLIERASVAPPRA